MPGIPEAPVTAAAALNQLDVQSFLYAATYVAGYQEEGSSSNKEQQQQHTLPPHLAPPLTTTLQVTRVIISVF
jgi:hypothetical protein